MLALTATKIKEPFYKLIRAEEDESTIYFNFVYWFIGFCKFNCLQLWDILMFLIATLQFFVCAHWLLRVSIHLESKIYLEISYCTYVYNELHTV